MLGMLSESRIFMPADMRIPMPRFISTPAAMQKLQLAPPTSAISASAAEHRASNGSKRADISRFWTRAGDDYPEADVVACEIPDGNVLPQRRSNFGEPL